MAELVSFRDQLPEARVRALLWYLLQIEHGEDCSFDQELRLRLRLTDADIADLTLLEVREVKALLRQFFVCNLVRRLNNSLIIPVPKALMCPALNEVPALPPARVSNEPLAAAPADEDASVFDERVAKAIGIIRARYGDCELSIGSVAKELRISVWHLSRMFREQAGCGFRRYLRRFRIRSAREMLNRDLSIKEIAFAVGYKSMSDFDHHFKTMTTVNPSDFRSALRIISPQK